MFRSVLHGLGLALLVVGSAVGGDVTYVLGTPGVT